MDDKLFCFIMCSNNRWYAEECMHYINRLHVPEGYRIEVLTVEDAASMTAGYNEAMQSSQAKYKVYMHQDTFIINCNFIQDCLNIFGSDPRIGMIGNVGCKKMPVIGVMWETKRCGKLYETHIVATERCEFEEAVEGTYTAVEAIDGFIMITQYDVPWREDLFDKWDFYDASQSMEFIRRGYKVVVPHMDEPWCVHDCGFINLKNYEGERVKYVQEYLVNMHKIEIIAAVNNEAYWEECVRYIRRLKVPEGYELSCRGIRGASSMPEAYNQGLKDSDAKYKIYIHQDTFLIRPDLLQQLIAIFTAHPDIGMVGVIGNSEWRRDAVVMKARATGRTMGWNGTCQNDINAQEGSGSGLWDVAAIDGMFMATQYDIPWREDILKGWDFYDCSQSMEFRIKGYRVAVPYQETPWCLHDCGPSKLQNYDENRKAFCEAYAQYGFVYREEDRQELEAWKRETSGEAWEASKELLRRLPELTGQRRIDELKDMLARAGETGMEFPELSVLEQLLAIWGGEMKAHGREVFWEGCADYAALADRYREVKFGLYRLEYDIAQPDSPFLRLLQEGRLTEECLEQMIQSSVHDKRKVKDKLREITGAGSGEEKEGMKLLLYAWGANNERVFADNLEQAGFQLVRYDKPCRHYTRDVELAADMIPYIHAQHVEAVVSFNYFPIISMICDTCRIPYFAWVYDCPHFTLYARQIMLPCNHIGIFDREMARHLQEVYQVPHVFHAPLSVDTEHFDRMIRGTQGIFGGEGQGPHEKAADKYRCDVSFVGSLYTDEHNYYETLLSAGEQEMLRPLVERQCFRYDRDCIGEALAAEEIDTSVIKDKMRAAGLMLGEDYFDRSEDDILRAAVLDKKVTVEERGSLLQEVARRYGQTYRVAFYTESDVSRYPLLQKYHGGVVDYHLQMPRVFAGSRINLNITLRSIRSGIPLRVLDIMACGGFVLTNRQAEIDAYFEEGKELVCYDGMEDCMDKIAYYLEHEEERAQIAAAGRLAVRERFGYQKGIMTLFGIEA